MPMTEEEYQGNLEIQFVLLSRVVWEMLEHPEIVKDKLSELREITKNPVYVECVNTGRENLARNLGVTDLLDPPPSPARGT